MLRRYMRNDGAHAAADADSDSVAARDARFAVPGIQNLGNTCFFNAILQALASVESFHAYLAQIVEQSDARARPIPFTKALTDCVRDLAPVHEHVPCAVVVPRRLNQELCTKLASFRGNKQQDSQELLQFLINLVDDEQKKCSRRDGGLSDLFPRSMGLGMHMNGSANGVSSPMAAAFSGSISDLCFEDAMETRRWNPLYGMQVDLLQCAGCGNYRPMTNRRFLDVSLSFGEDASKKPVTLWDCLRMYTAPETISGVECSWCTAAEELKLIQRDREQMQREVDAGACDMATELALYQLNEDMYKLEAMMDGNTDKLYQLDVAGERCRALRDCQKRLQFSRCPDVFCFHFNRKVFHAYSGNARKVDTHVVFPIELDMSAFCRYEQPANSDPSAAATGHSNGYSIAGAPKNGKCIHLPSQNQQYAPSQSLYLIYELVAVILHHGNERHGHFTAFRRLRSSNQWFFISDDSVREVSEDDVLGSCAYMLFYERKHRTGETTWQGKKTKRSTKAVNANGFHATASNDGEEGEEVDEDDEAALARVPDESR